MTNVPSKRDAHIFDGRPMRNIQARWGRLSMSDLVQISTKDQLIANVKERYGLPIGATSRPGAWTDIPD